MFSSTFTSFSSSAALVFHINTSFLPCTTSFSNAPFAFLTRRIMAWMEHITASLGFPVLSCLKNKRALAASNFKITSFTFFKMASPLRVIGMVSENQTRRDETQSSLDTSHPTDILTFSLFSMHSNDKNSSSSFLTMTSRLSANKG